MTTGVDAMTVGQLWAWRVETSPAARFLRTAEGDYSYAEFDLTLNRWVNGLAAVGVTVASRVALLLPTGTELLMLELALQKMGAVMVPLIAGSSAPEVAHVLADSEPSHVLFDFKVESGVREVIEGSAATGTQTFVVGDANDPTRNGLFVDDTTAPATPAVGYLDPMSILYTSGSTGRPKGVLQPHAGFMEAGRTISERLGITAADTYLCVLPLFHTGATHVQLAPAIYAGSAFAFDPSFSRSRFWERVRTYGATTTVLVPAQMSMLMTNPPSEDDRDTGLRLAISQKRSAAFTERFGVDIATIWSMSETSGMGALSNPGVREADVDPKFIGQVMPESGELRIIDTTGANLGPEQVGELLYRQKYVMRGYFRDAENTAASLDDGWVHTGDLGALDANGNMYYHGRLKSVIKRAGENIAGEELEGVIMEHPAVEQCLVTGVPDPIYTEEVYAAIVVRDGMELSEPEVTEWCGARLSKWKVPRYVKLQKEPFPTLQNGKPDKLSAVGKVDPSVVWDRLAVQPRKPTT